MPIWPATARGQLLQILLRHDSGRHGTPQKLAFADRLAYVRNEGFRTPDLALPFNVLVDLKGPKQIGAPGRTNFELSDRHADGLERLSVKRRSRSRYKRTAFAGLLPNGNHLAVRVSKKASVHVVISHYLT